MRLPGDVLLSTPLLITIGYRSPALLAGLSLALWFWVTKDERRTTKTRSRRRNVLRPPSFVPPALRAAASVRPVLCGAVAGLAALCKPNVSGLALLLALAALWERRGRWRQALIEAGSILLAAAVVVSPWVLRNWAVFGRPFLSNAHLGYVARVTAPATGITAHRWIGSSGG